MKYRIQKRVANTTVWKTVGHADNKETAIEMANQVIGGRSTGVRIAPLDPIDEWRSNPWGVPVLVVGSEDPMM